MNLSRSLYNEADGGGGGGGAVVTPPATPVEVPWSEYASKHADPAKIEAYKEAKTWAEVHDLQSRRLADAQTALRQRQPGLPPRPAADAPAEAVTAWRLAHGLPETAEGYGLTKPDGLPDELYDAAQVKAFASFAHEKGLAPGLVKDLQAWYIENTQGTLGEMQQAQAKQMDEMRLSEAAELGKRFGDKLDATLKDVQAVTQAMGRDPAVFDPSSDKFWGVEALQFATDLLKRVPRGEDGTVRNVGAPSQNGAYDKTWAKASMQKGHPDYEARTNPRDPRHKEISRLANEAYALG